jgi:hydrogenase expression/formation protein HypD
LPASGLVIREDFAAYDAERKFAVTTIKVRESAQCKSGSVLQGLLKPDGCPAFARECTPEHPLGATMVSDEGACAAYYKYHRTSHA